MNTKNNISISNKIDDPTETDEIAPNVSKIGMFKGDQFSKKSLHCYLIIT